MRIQRRKTTSYAGIAVVAACFCMIFTCLGFCSSNKSLYLSAITEALGIKRSLFSMSDSCRYISTAVMNLFFGTLIYKLGVKKLVAAGFACLTISCLIYANATQVAVFCVGGCFLGVGLAWTSTTMSSYLINKWFKRNRGTINGLVLCANGLGGAAAAQIVTPVIYQEGNAFGYRTAYYLVAAILLIVGTAVVFILREPDKAMTPVAEQGKKSNRKRQWAGIPLSEALRKHYFYMAAVCVFLTGMSLQGINGIAAAHLSDVGIRTGFVATVLSIHSVALCGSKLFAGFSYDKLGLRFTILVCELFGIGSFLTLAFSNGTPAGMGCAVAWAIMSALALPLETVMVPLIAADLFGEKDFSKLMGIFVSVNTAGYAFGTPIANLIFDRKGSYMPVLYLIAGLMAVVMIGVQYVITAANKTRLQTDLQAGGNEEE